MRRRLKLALAALCLLVAAPAAAADTPPWRADVAYGDDALQTLDVYRPADDDAALPAILFIHGGGWWNGDKSYVPSEIVRYFLDRHIAFVAINYRNLSRAKDDGLFPPLLGPLRDAQRALQFVRANATALRIDPARIALYGESAGAYDALWLGLSKDKADPRSPDPIARMSTRVAAIGAAGAQTTIDPKQMRDWVGPQLRYGGHAFGLPETDFDAFLARRAAFARWFPTLSPAALIHRGEPPVFLIYQEMPDLAATDPMYFVHSPEFGRGFEHVAQTRGAGADVTLRIGARLDPSAKAAFLAFLAAAVARN